VLFVVYFFLYNLSNCIAAAIMRKGKADMRTEQQVIHQLLTFARSNDLIRALAMNGSRVNPNAPQDLFCDYDVVYYVTDPHHFLEDQAWIPYFGDLIILQQNDFVDHGVEGHIFLMLFTDGVRIDLSFNSLSNLAYLQEDTLTAVLLDKDGRIAPLPSASDAGYHTPRPSQKEFADAINEIFWCATNVAKGIWRDELPYVKFMYDAIIREQLLKILAWYTAAQHNWEINTGKFGRWLKQHLSPEIWDTYVKTYACPGYQETWEALLEACRLTRRVGQELAQGLGYAYPLEEDRRTVEYLRAVRALPKDSVSYDGLSDHEKRSTTKAP
jgi:aminoglycoside 6-adenylyltransferase